jgi:hypothetical protein
MLKLHLTHEQMGPSQHDTNIAPDKCSAVKAIEFKKRGEGVGGGFKGRSPNKATIWMGDKDWRNIVLPDDYNVDNVQEVVISDSQGIMPALKFVKSSQNPRMWDAQQPEAALGNQVPGYQGAPSRTFAVRRALKNAFDYLGEVGVNDLGYLLNCEIMLPTSHDNEGNRNNILDLADQLKAEMGTPVSINFVVTGQGQLHGEVVGEGHLGAHPHADRAMAGRQQIAPINYPSGTGPVQATALQTVPAGGESLKPGQNEQSYGSDGPQDK